MSLSIGSTAPAFEVTDVNGTRVSLEASRGKYTLLSFHRFAACPLCNLSIRRMSNKAPELLERGLRVIQVLESSDVAVRKALETWGPQPFTLIADAEASLYQRYEVPLSAWGAMKSMSRLGELRESMRAGLPRDVPQDGSKTRIPASFFIGPDLNIVEVYVGQDAGDSVPVETVERWLQAVETHARKVA